MVSHMEIEQEGRKPSFVEALTGEKKNGKLEEIKLNQNLLLDLDKISISPPSPYPSIELDPKFKLSLENQWRKAIIIKVLGRSLNFPFLQNRLINLWKPPVAGVGK